MDSVIGTKHTKEQFTKLLENGECPICGKAGYKNILLHIAQIHKILRNQLKDELLITRSKGFLAEDSREIVTINNTRNGFRKGHRIRKSNFKYDSVSKEKISKHAKGNKNIYKYRSKGCIALYGTELGYPDIFYAKVAEELIKFLGTGHRHNIYTRISRNSGVKRNTVEFRIKTAIARGMIKYTGEKRYPNGELTEKAKLILNNN